MSSMGLKGAVGSGATAALLAMMACVSDGDSSGTRGKDEAGATVERVKMEAPDSFGFEPVAVGDVLLKGSEDFEAPELLYSTDLGDSWKTAALPDLPANLSVTNWRSLNVESGVATVTATDQAYGTGRPYVWASRDGVTWHGGRLSDKRVNEEPSAFEANGMLYASMWTASSTVEPFQTTLQLLRSEDGGASWSPARLDLELELENTDLPELTEIWEHTDGTLVIPLQGEVGVGVDSVSPTDSTTQAVPSVRRATALTSQDNGLSWQVRECPIPDLPEWSECVPPDGVTSLAIQYDQVSLDGGTTWQQPSFDEPTISKDGPPEFNHVVELPGGGWLATGGTNLPSQDPLGFLARSEDGLNWDVLLPAEGRPAADIDKPVRFGDGWLLGFSVLGRDRESSPSQLYLLDVDGANLRPIADTQAPGHRYGQPLIVGSTAVVPETDSAYEKGWLVRVTL